VDVGETALTQALIGVVWVWGLASLPDETPLPLPKLGRAVFWLLAVANLVEIASHYETIKAAPGSIYANVAQTFLWGRIYLREIGAVV
jgi:hypothetical protein